MPSENTSKCGDNPLPTFRADGVPTIRALETITFGDKKAVTMKTSMTEADFSGKELGASGAIIVAAFLLKCQ